MGMESLKVLTHPDQSLQRMIEMLLLGGASLTAGAESIYISQVTCSLRPEQKVV